jgi:hypothetical protein
MRRKEILAIALLFAAVIVIILIIRFVKGDGSESEKVMMCIANKSEIYYSRTCVACASQEDILGNYFDVFQKTECIAEKQKCRDAEIERYPTWIIDNKKYIGVHTISQLRMLTGC